MYFLRSPKRARHWEEFGLVLGAVILALNSFALLTPYLSGPIFHPVGILLGIMIVFVSGFFWTGGGLDQLDRT